MLKLKNGRLKSKWSSLLVGVVVFVAFLTVTTFSHLFFGRADESCGELEWNARCELSPTAHMLYGDALTGGAIALFLSWFFHFLSHKNQVKIEQIIESEQNMRNRRKDYAVSHLKNLLSLLFFTTNLLKGSLAHYNRAAILSDENSKLWLQSTYLSRVRADEAKVGRILISVRNILVAANDVLEPEMVNRIEGVCNFIGELSTEENQDGKLAFPKMNVSKIKIQYLLELLKTYSVTTRSFADLEESYQPSTFMSRVPINQEVQQ
jgi:hypothetical protein